MEKCDDQRKLAESMDKIYDLEQDLDRAAESEQAKSSQVFKGLSNYCGSYNRSYKLNVAYLSSRHDA